ncbi:MAG TPA: Crp/Fnr family transcriptional regulator [Magnetospirillum sp.]|nr:Crp/Fnr family transcriptional regulator [Magnetospirillum sp.]
MFEGVPPDQLEALAVRSTVVSLSAREMLFSKGDTGNLLYLVVRGMIRVGVVSADGREVTYALVGPGHLFGEIAVLDNGPRTADASAIEASELLAIERRHVLTLLAQNPECTLRLISVLCQRIRQADQLLEDIFFLSLPSRLAKQLLVLSDIIGQKAPPGAPVTIRMSQQAVADHMGISRESVNKVLSKWEQAGLVSLWRGQITIHDRERLDAFLNGE